MQDKRRLVWFRLFQAEKRYQQQTRILAEIICSAHQIALFGVFRKISRIFGIQIVCFGR